MGCFSGPEIVNDGLVFSYDMNNRVKSWKGKPVENLVASGQRTCSSGLTRMAYHREAYTYVVGISAHGRKDVIKVTCSPTGTDSIAPYADFGFSVSRAGGSQIGDVYWISFDYKNIRGGNNPSIGIVYANGYKQPDAAVVGTFEPQITTDLENGWKRVTRKCTMTAAGASWWRFGQNSGNEEVEFYLDNFQIIHSDVDAPFVDGTRSNTEALLDVSGQENTITADSLIYNNDGSFGIAPNGELIVPHSTTLHPTDAYTSEVWLWADSSQDNLYPRVWDKSSILVHISQTSPFTIAQNTSTSAGLRQVAIGGVFAHSTWTHITTSYNGQVGKIYVNGSEIASTDWGSVSAPSANSTSLGIGGGSTSTNRQFNGKISTFRFYNRALTANEVKQNFENTRTQYGV